MKILHIIIHSTNVLIPSFHFFTYINIVWNRKFKRNGSSQSITEIKYLEKIRAWNRNYIYMLICGFLRVSCVDYRSIIWTLLGGTDGGEIMSSHAVCPSIPMNNKHELSSVFLTHFSTLWLVLSHGP